MLSITQGGGSWQTVTGAIVEFTTQSASPIRLTAELEPIQSGTGDPSPENIRPISGHTGADVYVKSAYDASATPTTTITFPQAAGTVYGGTLTVNEDGTGVLTVLKAYALLNNPDGWATSSGTQDFSYDYAVPSRKYYSNSFTGLLCSAYPASTSFTAYCRWTSSTSRHFGIKDSTKTLDDIKAMASANQIAICYDIDPVEYSMTASQINTLQGTNVVWVDDSDEITVEFLK